MGKAGNVINHYFSDYLLSSLQNPILSSPTYPLNKFIESYHKGNFKNSLV